jgi:hypothetical protein
VSISAISASGAVSAYTPVSSTNLYASINPGLNATTPPANPPITQAASPILNPPVVPPLTDPVTTSTTIAQTYGFAPSLIVPGILPLIYQAINPNPDTVTGVAPVAVIPRAGTYPGYLFDSVA